ncbi:hypothetical protein FKM82_017701 [Ascaphus truei]
MTTVVQSPASFTGKCKETILRLKPEEGQNAIFSTGTRWVFSRFFKKAENFHSEFKSNKDLIEADQFSNLKSSVSKERLLGSDNCVLGQRCLTPVLKTPQQVRF